MSFDTFTCPDCGVQLRRSPQLLPGTRVQCPKCGLQFPVPPEEVEPLALAPSNAPDARGEIDHQHTGTRRADDPPRGPNRFDDFGRAAPDEEVDEDYAYYRRRRGSVEDLSNNYRIDLNRWFSYAREHWAAILGPAIGYQLIVGVIGQATGLMPAGIGLFAYLLLMPPLNAGMTIITLAQLKGQRWRFSDFFSGFKFYGPTVVLAVLNLVLQVLFLGPIVAGIFALVVAHDSPEAVPLEHWAALAGAAAVLAIPLLYLWLRISFFSLHLVVDRGFEVGEALKGSWRLTRGHLGGLLGVSIAFATIYLGGLVLCLIGALFAVPFIALAQTAGYLLVAGSEPPVTAQQFDQHYPDEEY